MAEERDGSLLLDQNEYAALYKRNPADVEVQSANDLHFVIFYVNDVLGCFFRKLFS